MEYFAFRMVVVPGEITEWGTSENNTGGDRYANPFRFRVLTWASPPKSELLVYLQESATVYGGPVIFLCTAGMCLSLRSENENHRRIHDTVTVHNGRFYDVE